MGTEEEKAAMKTTRKKYKRSLFKIFTYSVLE